MTSMSRHARDAHDSHDLLVVSAWAVDDVAGDDRDRAIALVASCQDCAAVASEIRAITAAMATLPAPVRPRDFRLTEGDAHRLRPSGWRRALRVMTSPTLAFTRPLAAGLTTLGLVGVVVTSVPMGAFSAATGGSAAQAPAAALQQAESDSATDGGNALGPLASPASAPVASRAASDERDTSGGGPTTMASGEPNRGTARASAGASPAATSVPAAQPIEGFDPGGPRLQAGPEDAAPVTPSGPSLNPFFALSLALLLAGIGLFLLRWIGRRQI